MTIAVRVCLMMFALIFAHVATVFCASSRIDVTQASMYLSQKVVEEQYNLLNVSFLDVATVLKLRKLELHVMPARVVANNAAKPFVDIWYEGRGQISIQSIIKRYIDDVLPDVIGEIAKRNRKLKDAVLFDDELFEQVKPIIFLTASFIKLHYLLGKIRSDWTCPIDYDTVLTHMNTEAINAAFVEKLKNRKPTLRLQQPDKELDNLWYQISGSGRVMIEHYILQKRDELLQQEASCRIM